MRYILRQRLFKILIITIFSLVAFSTSTFASTCKSAHGSPVWSVNKINMNLYVTDIPIWYNPPIGPSVEIQISYNSQATIVSGVPFGNKWQFNYQSYLIEDIPNSKVTVYMPAGRKDVYTGTNPYTPPLGVFSTLTKIASNSFELKLLDGTTYIYQIPSGTSLTNPYLVGIRDAYNQSLTIGYNASNQLSTITDATGKTLTLSYTNGLVTAISDTFGRSAAFGYTNGDLTAITDMGGYATTLSYAGSSYISGITTSSGTTVFYIEPNDGNCTNPVPYPAPGNPMCQSYRITVTDPLNQKEEYFYYSYTGVYSWYVSPRDYVSYVDGNTNNLTNAIKTYYYLDRTNPKGDISKIQYPEGGYTQYSNIDTVTGKYQTITDNHGTESHSTNYLYNSTGLPTSITDARSKTTTYEYYSNNIDLYRITQSGLQPPLQPRDYIEFTYNGNTHDIATITDRMGITTEFSYNNSTGQLQTITEAKNTAVQTITELVYDPTSHNLTEIKKAGSTLTTFTNDTIGRVQTKTDATGLTLGYKYNNLDQVINILYPDTVYDGTTPISKFLTIGRSACCTNIIDYIIDRGGQTTTYTHDALKRLTQVSGPNGIYDYEYDANSNMTKLKDSNRSPAVETVFEYNLDNLLKKKIYSGGKLVEYTLDKMGLVKVFKNARGTTATYTHDSNHNLLTIDYSDTTPDVAFTYDDYNRSVTRTDGIGTSTYGFDANNRLTSVDGPLTNDTITYQYNELGQTTNTTPQGGQAVSYVYDTLGRLQNINKGADNFTYGYTGINPLIQTLTRPNGSLTEYQYNDPLNKLTSIINKNSTNQIINSFAHTYYTSGPSTDLIWKEEITNGEPIDTFVAGTTTYTNNNLNQLTSTSNPNRTYTYDDDGNMTQGFTPEGYTLTMTYDAENRMTSAEYVNNSITYRTEYSYSGVSLLAEMKKKENGNITSTTRYLRAGFLPIQERDASNALTREYTWGLNLGGGIGGLLNLRQNSNDYSYLYDGKGNVSSLINSAQSPVANYRYDPFGVLMKKTSTIEQPYMFSTKGYDLQTGLTNYGYRFADLHSGKWTTRDPLGEYGGINLYRAMGNNAVNWIDPWGLWIGQMPPSPPGYDPSTWKPSMWDDGTPFIEDPSGKKWLPHTEDKGHWRHWDKQGPGGKDEGDWPPNSKKPEKNRKKKLKPDQCETDPSGDAEEFQWPRGFLPFMPLDPVNVPIRIPVRFPIRIPIPAWVW